MTLSPQARVGRRAAADVGQGHRAARLRRREVLLRQTIKRPGSVCQHDDEVWLGGDDSYRGIPLKVQAIMRWAAEHCYDVTAKCDDDVYVIPERFPYLSCEMSEYTGRFRTPHGKVYPVHFASGFFYWLRNRAMQTVADTPWNGDWMDERFVATALARRGMFGMHDADSYKVTGPAPCAVHRSEHRCSPARYSVLRVRPEGDVRDALCARASRSCSANTARVHTTNDGHRRDSFIDDLTTTSRGTNKTGATLSTETLPVFDPVVYEAEVLRVEHLQRT